MTTGNNPTTDRSKLGKAKRHILTDKQGIPLSAVIISSAKTHDIKLVTDVVDNVWLSGKDDDDHHPNTEWGKKNKKTTTAEHIYVLIKDIILNTKNRN